MDITKLQQVQHTLNELGVLGKKSTCKIKYDNRASKTN